MASTFESVALIIYDKLKPALEAIVKKVTEVLKWFQGLSPEMQKQSASLQQLPPLLVRYSSYWAPLQKGDGSHESRSCPTESLIFRGFWALLALS
ncbi:hypothetical protein P7H17_25485 [Paenibacillus larvae]|nr:hypothetical protein [Paenibacillus larvae]MDT2288730.1 hypothetical protein [Paenibacillus larvae]